MTDPRPGVTLEAMVAALVEAYGFDELAKRVPLPCFQAAPSLAAAVAFLAQTPEARAQVERVYQFHLRADPRARRGHAEDLRSAAGLMVHATQGVVSVVEGVHAAIGAVPVITPLIYAAIRGITGLVGTGVDALVASLAPLLADSAPGRQREAMLAAVNGVVGDHLAAIGSPLAIPMSLRPPLPRERGGTLLVLVHGSSMSDLGWTRDGHDHGLALARDLGVTPAYVHYNSGRHVSASGADLAALLEREADGFTAIVVVGHSMGGLVARAAIRAAEDAGHAWRPKLRALVTVGTPHHGAGLERAGNLFETVLGVTRYSAPLGALGRIRSAGVTDLRFGNVVDADWRDRDRFAPGADPRTPTPLPADVRCYAVAGTTAPALDGAALPGDGIVAVASALGTHPDPAFTLAFTDRQIVAGVGHLDLLSSPAVYVLLRAWLAPDDEGAS